MLELAERLNQFPGKASYVCSTASNLHAFEDGAFDLVVTSIVLQHVEPEIALVYLHEFFRVLSPAGIVVFQLPSHRRRRTERAPVSIVHPMPDAAYCAALVVTCVPRRTVTPGAEITLQVEITNLSAVAWSQREFGVMAVGNHWFDGAGGRLLIRDDGRTSLPGTLASGATCRVPLTIKVPQDSGEYECEVDVAHEGVLWFHGKGSRVVRFPVRVGVREDFDPDVVGGEAGPRPDRDTPAVGGHCGSECGRSGGVSDVRHSAERCRRNDRGLRRHAPPRRKRPKLRRRLGELPVLRSEVGRGADFRPDVLVTRSATRSSGRRVRRVARAGSRQSPRRPS